MGDSFIPDDESDSFEEDQVLEVVEDAPAKPGLVEGFKQAAVEKRQRINAAPDVGPLDDALRVVQSTPIGDAWNYLSGVIDDPSGFKRDGLTLLRAALPGMRGAILGPEESLGGALGAAAKEGKLGELWDTLMHDAGRTAGSGGLDPQRPVLSPLDAVAGGSIATQAPKVAAAAGRGVSRAASATGRGFKVKALENELGPLARDVKATRSLERVTKMPAKHADELRRLHTKLLSSEKDIRRLKPHIQRKYRAAWDAKRAGDPQAQSLYDDAFKALMSDERTPAIERQRAAMKVKEGDAARAHLADADAVESAMRNRQLAEKTHGEAVKMLDDIGQNNVADVLGGAQRWAGRTGSIGAIATGAATQDPLAALGTAVAGYGTKAALSSPRVMGATADIFYRIAGRSNVAARKLAALGVTASSPPEKVLQAHALLSTVDEEYARETGAP